jgi:hypothetical protein
MHSDAQLTLFSSCSLGKTSKLLLRSLVRRFAAALFSTATRQDVGSLGIGITQWLVLQKDKNAQRSCAIAVDIAGALSK